MTHPVLKPCPFCGEKLTITKSNMAVHEGQSQGDCILSGMGIAADHPESVDKWNKRASEGVEKRIADLEAALDSGHASVGSNIWRFWSDKARDIAANNAKLRLRLKSANNTLECIASGSGMFGLSAEEDLKWAMNLADKTHKMTKEKK